MSARKTPSINVEIGGFVVKLLCPDPKLYRRIQSSFPCFSGHQKPFVTLEVHSSNSPWEVLPKENYCLDGEGEYVAAFNPAGRRAVIHLTGSNEILALANFIRRIFARLVIDNQGAVFHSACVVRNGPGFAGGCAEASGAYIFFGKSGAGKSTVCALSPGAIIASDDLTVIRIMRGRMLAWGLPAFRSTPYRLSQGPFLVRAAFTMIQDSRNFIKRLKAPAAIAGMLALPADLTDPEPVAKTVDLLARLVQSVPCYELHFSKDPVFWNAIDAEVTGEVQRFRVQSSGKCRISGRNKRDYD